MLNGGLDVQSPSPDRSGILFLHGKSFGKKDTADSGMKLLKKWVNKKLPKNPGVLFYALIYIAFLISSFTFSSFGNHSANNAAEYGAGASGVVILLIGASR